MNFINFFIFQIYIFTFAFFKSYHGKNKNLKKSTPQWNPIEVCKFLFFTSHTIGNPKSTDVNTNWNNAIGGLLKITSGKWIRLCGTTVNKYVKNNYDRINVTFPKGQKEVIMQAAEAAGESVNGYIKKAVNQRMERDNA